MVIELYQLIINFVQALFIGFFFRDEFGSALLNISRSLQITHLKRLVCFENAEFYLFYSTFQTYSKKINKV